MLGFIWLFQMFNLLKGLPNVYCFCLVIGCLWKSCFSQIFSFLSLFAKRRSQPRLWFSVRCWFLCLGSGLLNDVLGYSEPLKQRICFNSFITKPLHYFPLLSWKVVFLFSSWFLRKFFLQSWKVFLVFANIFLFARAFVLLFKSFDLIL